MSVAEARTLPRLTRDQYHLHFDPHEEPRLRIPAGARVIVETEDAHLGTIRSERDVYRSLEEVFEKLGGANPVTGPIFVEGVEAGDCVAVHLEDIVPGPVQGQGYTVLTPGLGGLVSNYSLQPSLEPRTVICEIRDETVLFPARKGPVEISTAPFLGTSASLPLASAGSPTSRGPTSSETSTFPCSGSARRSSCARTSPADSSPSATRTPFRGTARSQEPRSNARRTSRLALTGSRRRRPSTSLSPR